MSDLLSLLLGWLLGTLSPSIADAISRRKRMREVAHALAAELDDLRYKTALVAHQVRARTGTMTLDSLARYEHLIARADLPGEDGKAGAAMASLLDRVGAEAYIAVQNEQGPKNPGFWPVPYGAPFLEVSVGQIFLFRPRLQAALLRVKSELHLYNHQVEFVKTLTERTFQLTGPNYQINQGNLRGATMNLIVRCDYLIDAINAVFENGDKSFARAR